ncbi:MAG TPA: hypothetical protein VIF08_05430 [Candidatus Limnocylindrales bacterium]|jgi:hypothetical protein
MIGNIRRHAIRWFAVALIGAGLVSFPAGVAAKDTDVIRTGSCSGASDWKLKAKPDNGRLEVEFEVDQNVNNRTWSVKLKKNGNVFWQGQRTTHAPSGSFSVTKFTGNPAGTDTIVGRAVNPATGEVCQGSLTI